MKLCLQHSLPKGFTLSLYLSQHTYFLQEQWAHLILNVAGKFSRCDAHVIYIGVFHVLQMLPSVWWHYLCTCVSGFTVLKEGLISVVFYCCFFFYKSNIECSIYWIYILVISLKEKETPVIPVWWCCAGFNLAQPVYWSPSGGNGHFPCLSYGTELCLNLNFNPAPYVLMPRWRVWFVPVVQRKSLFHRVPVTTIC